jgi:hypothetical protein
MADDGGPDDVATGATTLAGWSSFVTGLAVTQETSR